MNSKYIVQYNRLQCFNLSLWIIETFTTNCLTLVFLFQNMCEMKFTENFDFWKYTNEKDANYGRE